MGYRGTRTLSPLASDFMFMILAMAATMGYIVSSSLLSAVKQDLRHQDGGSGETQNRASEVYVSKQTVSSLRDNVNLVSLPDQPDQMVLMLLSIVASKSEITQSISDAIIECLSQESETETKNWGAFSMDRFAPTLVQVEYFVLTSEKESLKFPEKVDGYIRNGTLTECVKQKGVGLSENGNLLDGRTVIAADAGSIVSSSGQVPGWAIGAAIACVVGIGVIALVLIRCMGERVYSEEDYDKYEEDESVNDGEMSESEDEELRSINVVDTIPGQGRPGIVCQI